jgi:1-acyl-sn-glycerol-3-phosphate acyltransferase
MTIQYRIPLHIQISRRIMRVLFRFVFRLLGRVELYGMDKIPTHNKYMIVFNHVSLVEVPFIAAFWPTIIEIIGAAAVWERAGQAIIARGWAGIQVRRGEFDREVFKQVEKVFAADHPMMISPEGGRSHTPGLRRGKPGVAYIIDKVNVPVIPVGVVGNTMDFVKQGLQGKKPTIQLIVGDLIHLPHLTGRGEERRKMRQQNTDFIMAKLAEILPAEYRGVYAEYQKILDGMPFEPE